MTDGEHGDDQQEEPSEDEGFELTSEQQEALRETMAQARRSLVPALDFRLPSMSELVPDSVLKNTVVLSAFAETQQMIASSVLKPFLEARQAMVGNALNPVFEARQAIASNALKPLLDSQAAWGTQLSAINSNIFNTAALQQPNLNLIAFQLTRTIDFGFNDTMAKAAEQFAAQQATWLSAIGPALANIRASFYPANLQDIEGLRLEQVEEVVMVDGIPLYGVPRASTAEALIRAESAGRRRDILGRRWKTISSDCREVATACMTPAVALYVVPAVSALDALDAGHTEAAQALAGSLIDAILRAYFKKDRYKFTPDRNGRRTKDAYDKFTIRQFIAFAPMWQAYQQFYVEDGDVVPNTFSRNATAHTVSPRQYNRRNAVQASMFACSLLCHLDGAAARQAAAA